MIILNKTPVHTPRTAELKEISALGGKAAKNVIDESQQESAMLLYEFWLALSHNAPMPVWITGYSEMKPNGIFKIYTQTLITLMQAHPDFAASIYLFRHFSMNQFTADLRKKMQPGEAAGECLERLGTAYRDRIVSLNTVI